ncbi:DUF4283 domain-containing protein [Raphanus sativus]|nr:DUF4283 domain-containing protein [Raphanus sativus]
MAKVNENHTEKTRFQSLPDTLSNAVSLDSPWPLFRRATTVFNLRRRSPPSSLPPGPSRPTLPLSPHLFPPLASTLPPTKSERRRTHHTISPSDTEMTLAQGSPPTLAVTGAPSSTSIGPFAETTVSTTAPATGNPNPTFLSTSTSGLVTPPVTGNPLDPAQFPPNVRTIQPNHNSPLFSNRASSSSVLPPTLSPPASLPSPNLSPLMISLLTPFAAQTPTPTLVESLRLRGDKSLQRLAPVTISETGRPRVLIPDSVFEKGAELHRDFIICYFNGRPPPFKHIQSV